MAHTNATNFQFVGFTLHKNLFLLSAHLPNAHVCIWDQHSVSVCRRIYRSANEIRYHNNSPNTPNTDTFSLVVVVVVVV